MRIVIRADASTRIGTGHVMRCLTLAQALIELGHQCVFVQRAHVGNLLQFVAERGVGVESLPTSENTHTYQNDGDYAAWLGASQQEDADQTLAAIGENKPDWLVVDHYSLDVIWEERLLPHVGNMLALDDMANRSHACQLLLDQNFGATKQKYQEKIEPNCTVLAGANYALLSPEFARRRDSSLERRRGNNQVHNILISMGGVDADNYTGRIVDQLARMPLDEDLDLVIILGATSPHIDSVRQSITKLSCRAVLKVGVSDVAELMAEADLAIGAAGTTSWERCCLGLPTIQLVVAENQRQIGDALAAFGAVRLIDEVEDIPPLLSSASQWLLETSEKSAKVLDGLGVQRVTDVLMNENYCTE
jgi:UDP-2,4-diacetamido-2,4,6-trideoxy-beta-L-altropyranose hydrolase